MTQRLRRAMAFGALLLAAATAFAADADLARAKSLFSEGKYQAAYELLAPFAVSAKADAAFNLQFGETALALKRPDEARQAFLYALTAEPGSVAACP